MEMDENRLGDKFIITGLLNLVEDNGLTPHEAFEVLEDIKRNTFHALVEAKKHAE